MARPYINTYEVDHNGKEQLVYREMTEEEHAQLQVEVAALEAQETSQPHPLISSIEQMSDEDRARIADLLATSQAKVQGRPS